MFGIFGSGKFTDPVCKMKIDPEQAKYSLEHQGKKYYFCSENCRKAFDSSKADASGHCCC